MSNVPKTMDSYVSKTTWNTSDYLIARDGFLGPRSFRPDSWDFDEAKPEFCLDHAVWSNLPEELLIHIFARLPVKNILQIRSLSKSWRCTITSPQFQQAFSEASLVRISLLVDLDHRDTIFFSQENKEESFRPGYNRHYSKKVFKHSSDIAGTASGLICVIEYEGEEPEVSRSILSVFVMNLVTGVRRELPSPHVTSPFRPTLVQMKANINGGYTITFIYTKNREELQVTSWQVYDSVKNVWSKDEGRAIADFKDVEAFNINCSLALGQQFDVPATFHKETKSINVFNLHEGDERYEPGVYPSNPNGHVHNVSGELYKLCTREGRHGVWKLVCSSKWEMVCECPDLRGFRIGRRNGEYRDPKMYPDWKKLWTCLRVMNDWVVLIIELPRPYKAESWSDGAGHRGTHRDHGGIVKVFHMPTKRWHSFPEDDHFTTHFRFCDRHCLFDEHPFLVEIRFDSIP